MYCTPADRQGCVILSIARKIIKMGKTWLSWGAVLALTAVALGAFGAHGLKAVLAPDRLEIFHTGIRYQFYHAFALLFLGVWQRATANDNKYLPWAGTAFLVGVFLFSGSIYALAVRDWLNWPVSWLGPVTPIGGLLFILGWIFVLLTIFKEE